MPKFKHRPLPVEAVLYTGHNADEIVRLGGSAVKVFPSPPSPRERIYIEDDFYHQTWLPDGHWLVREKDGRLVVYDDEVFRASFYAVGERRDADKS